MLLSISCYCCVCCTCMVSKKYCIAGNFQGRKLSQISRFESHPRNCGACRTHLCWFQAIRESFVSEILTSYGSAKIFSLESLLLYGSSNSLVVSLIYRVFPVIWGVRYGRCWLEHPMTLSYMRHTDCSSLRYAARELGNAYQANSPFTYWVHKKCLSLHVNTKPLL